jgi:hypothetical protein
MAALLFVLVFSNLEAGCETRRPPALNSVTYPVSPVIREIYTTLGGESLLGPAITELFNYGSLNSSTPRPRCLPGPELDGYQPHPPLPAGRGIPRKGQRPAQPQPGSNPDAGVDG